MRAVFSIELPCNDSTYPDNDSLSSIFRSFGWEFEDILSVSTSDIEALVQTQRRDIDVSGRRTNVVNNVTDVTSSIHPKSDVAKPKVESYTNEGSDRSEAIRNKYTELAATLFSVMPEVAAAERNAVLFIGYIASDQTLFVATRMVAREVTIRLLQVQLPRLQRSSKKLVKALLSTHVDNSPLTIPNPTIRVFERGYEHVILNGRVITSPVKEALKSNPKDRFLSLVGLVIFVLTTITLLFIGQPADIILYGLLDKTSTAALTIAVVSMVGLFETWWQIKKNKLIDWSVHSDLNDIEAERSAGVY